jgi:hypothetical protein
MCAYQFRKSNRAAIGFSFMNSNSGHHIFGFVYGILEHTLERVA